MTGVTLTVTLDAQLAGDAFARLGGLSHRELLKRLGVGLVETTLQRFESAKDAQGSSWAPLNPVYAAMKRGPGILREKAMRGGLMGSITFKVGPGQVAIGSNKVYAAVHQFGATIKPKGGGLLVFKLGGKTVRARSVTIPARPYLGFGAADRLAVSDVVDFYLGELLKKP